MLLDLLDIIYISYIYYIYIYIYQIYIYIHIYISFQQEKYDWFLIKSSRVQTCEEKTLKINDMHKKKNKADIVTNMIIIWNLTKQITKKSFCSFILQGCRGVQPHHQFLCGFVIKIFVAETDIWFSGI